MRTIMLMTAGLLLATALTGCQRERPAAETAADSSPEQATESTRPARAPLPPDTTRHGGPRAVAPVMTGPTPPIAEGAIVQYDCDDGNALTIVYAGGAAKVTLPDGRTAQLARAGNANEGGELYQGGALRLRRAGNGIEFFQDETGRRLCIEGVSSA